jgi:hypothetical protein
VQRLHCAGESGRQSEGDGEAVRHANDDVPDDIASLEVGFLVIEGSSCDHSGSVDRFCKTVWSLQTRGATAAALQNFMQLNQH